MGSDNKGGESYTGVRKMVKEKRETSLIVDRNGIIMQRVQNNGNHILGNHAMFNQGKMNPERARMNRKRGFTLIEILVVVAIIAILLAVIVPALGKAKEMVKKTICKNNIRNQCLGTILYSEANNGWVPTFPAGNWFWDISFWSTNEIARESGIDYKSFFCPVNRIKKPGGCPVLAILVGLIWAGVNLNPPSSIAMSQRSAY